MSKLFDRIDHEWEMKQIDEAEQLASRTLSGFGMAALDGSQRQIRGKEGTLKSVGQRSEWDRLRARSRMKLLKTGQLMADLRFARGLFKACPKCHTNADGKERACDAHKSILRKTMMAVKYAGEDNMQTRLAQGRVWGDDDAVATEDRGLNQWEQTYREDQRKGIWPGTPLWSTKCAQKGKNPADELARMKEQYGSLGYPGWLEMLFQIDEITSEEYRAEKARLAEYA